MAKELDWIKPWDKVKEWNYPYARWFTNAKLNISANCLDRHVNDNRRNKVALIWRGEEGRERIFTYQNLLSQVARFANALKNIGVKKGDCVCIYMPLVPEQLIAMLACARIGAVHSVVFGGFGAAALNMRIQDAEAKVVITADISIRRGKAIQLKAIVDEAIIDAPSVEHVVVLRRREPKVDLNERELDFNEMMEGMSDTCPPEVMDAEDPFFILYTSGSTGKPKGIVHTCGGYMVGTYYTSKYVFDMKDNDVFWCHGRPRLDHRPQLHRVRPACRGCNGLHHRARPGLPGCRQFLEPDRGAEDHHLLHGTDRHPDVHEDGRELAQQI
jgi:acetyl-CoA synthetase